MAISIDHMPDRAPIEPVYSSYIFPFPLISRLIKPIHIRLFGNMRLFNKTWHQVFHFFKAPIISPSKYTQDMIPRVAST